MYRALLVLILAAFAAGCATVERGVGPQLRYTLVADGRIAKTLSLPADAEEVSIVIQPRSGESAIWQTYEASYAYIVLKPWERDATPTGGRKLDLRGKISYYRNLKMVQKDGNDVVVGGKPLKTLDVKARELTVEPGKPVVVALADGLHVEIAVLPEGVTPPAAP